MDNNKKTKEYLEKWQNLKLSDSARARMEKELAEYARFHGVRVTDDSRSIEQAPTLGASYISRLFNLNSKSMTAFIVTLALLIGGGTSYAAEGAVPGDLLYPIKVEVNENIKSALAVSAEAEARLQARLAQERLEEAEKLAARGELSADASANLSTRLKTHYNYATIESDKAEARGDFESAATVRASLEGTFRTYADILSDLNVRVSGNSGDKLITDIRSYADASATAQATATVDVSAKIEIENTIARAENLITETKTKLVRAKGKLSAEAYVRAEAKLTTATEASAQAKAQLRAELYREAYASAQAAIRMASEVEVMIRSALQLQVDVRLDTGKVIDVRTDVETDVRSDTTTDKGDTDSQSGESTDTNADARVDIENDTRIDTNVLDTTVETDTSVRTNTGLSL